jgi:hypothetical protein
MVKKYKPVHDEEKDDHHKDCFRCRLHDLWEELHEKNSPRFMLISMAEACGSILSGLETEDMLLFQMAVMKYCEDDQKINPADKTKH